MVRNFRNKSSVVAVIIDDPGKIEDSDSEFDFDCRCRLCNGHWYFDNWIVSEFPKFIFANIDSQKDWSTDAQNRLPEDTNREGISQPRVHDHC